MNLKHVFKSECPNVEELFCECSSLDKYFSNLQKQLPNVKTANYMKHGFEALVEAIILCEKGTLRINNYEPRPSCDNDLFVHGIGEKSSGSKVGVMVCLVDDTDIPLTSNSNHLTSFTSNVVEKFNVAVDEPKGMRIFSNVKSLHENTHSQFFNDKSVVFYLKSDIEKLINGNTIFWKSFNRAMNNTEKCLSSIPEKKLREYQKEASQKITDNTIGQVILPTGTGKTLIAIDAIYNEINSLSSINKSPCILIMTPRIVLTYQLLGDVINYFKAKRIDAQYLNLNSGIFDDDSIKKAMAEMGLPIRDVPSTTTIREIEFYYDKAVKDGVPFIISATYQSAPRMNGTKIPIDIAIHDEAHNLVVGRFSTDAKKEVLEIKANKKVFLTATPARSKDIDEEITNNEPYHGIGMDNEEKYGKEIYRKSPKEMIDAGEIVPPFIHIVNVNECKIKNKVIKISPENPMDEDVEKNVNLMAIVIESAFDEHLKQIKKHSCSPEKIGAKIIVVCSGDDTFRGFFFSDGFKEMKERRKDLKFFGISSNFGAWINGEHVPPQGGWFKEQFMLALKSLKPEDNAIVFHIDMLGEGIDVAGITGVLPFRELGTIKSCQTLGRAMRIVPEDRKNLYDGTRLASDREHMIKPYAWTIIPVYSINHQDIKQRIVEIVQKIRNEYGYKPYERFIIHTPHVVGPPPPTPPLHESSSVTNVNMDQVVEDVMVNINAVERQKEIMKELHEIMKMPDGVQEAIKQESVVEEVRVPAIENNELQNQDVFTLVYNGVTARGIKSGDKFVVLAGSGVREKITPSFQTTAFSCYMKIRNDLLTQKKFVNWKTVEDLEFKSPSAAACVLIGSAINGRTAWRQNGKTLGEIEK